MKRIFFLFITMILLVSCSSDNDSNTMGVLQGSYISATINGESYMADTNNKILGKYGATGLFYESNLGYGFSIGGIMIEDVTTVKSLSVAFGAADFDLLTNGFEFIDSEGIDIVEGYYNVTIDEEDVIEAFSEESTVYVKITSIDKVNRIISGEFNFIAYDDNDSNKTYNVTNGVFKNISYSEI